MEPNGYASQNGFNGMPNVNTKRTRSWPPTVDEALPYSPFSSVVPFNSDIIPVPTIGLRSSVSLFSSAKERDAARQGLESLNREAADPTHTSQRLQQTLQDLKLLLQPESVSQYKFKIGPKIISDQSSTPLPNMSLTPFTQLLYDATSPDFTYPSPQTPSVPKTQKAKKVSRKPKSPSRPPPAQIPAASTNTAAYDENSTITVQTPDMKPRTQTVTPPRPTPTPRSSSSIAVVIPARRPEYRPQANAQSRQSASSSATPVVSKASTHAPPHKSIQQGPHVPRTPIKQSSSQKSMNATPSGSNGNLTVIIPNLPQTFRSEEYGVLANSPSPDTPQHLSRKRKRSYSEGSQGELTMTYDQRQKSELAYKNLGDYLRDIFEAEDQMQPGAVVANNFFTTTNDGMGLKAATQSKVEGLLQKIIEVGRFSQVPLDDLLRLQKLCDNAIKDAETVNLKVDETLGESELQNLLQNMSIAELGLKSARTSLRLMAGGREDKQLYSENVIQAALNTFKNVMDTCMIPIVEMRSTGPTAGLFKLLSAERKVIVNLLTFCRRLLALLATIVAKTELSETIINTLEFSASTLIFVENAHSEKDSIIGVAKFDSMRVVAMDILSQIFLNNPAQRQGIFDEILTSLEKLPVTKQSARQFKLADGGSIQLVSALIMRLIQTSASKADNSKEIRRTKALEALEGDDEEASQPHGDMSSSNVPHTIRSEERAEKQVVTAIQELTNEVTPLLKTARDNAIYVVGYIVNRALKSTKAGDAPYRNLLDLFVEDFITCLNSVDWPAAELLLRLLLFKMVFLAEGDKTAAPAKNMALDLLGSMGAAISELISTVRKSAATIENDGSELGKYLSRLADASLDKTGPSIDLVAWACGPYRVSLEFLDERCSSDPQLSSAVGFYMAEWASKIFTTYDTLIGEGLDHTDNNREYGRLAYRLHMMIADKRWLSTEYSFESVTASHARLAYGVTLLNSQFCASFSRVFQIFLNSMTSEQATVRSKSMKSINQVLETDPSILDREWREVQNLLLKCSNDSSILVRDSALGLVGKCITLRPAFEAQMIPTILGRVSDSGIGVRKRAMRLSKDIYLRNDDAAFRSSIADALLQRVTDQDEGVQDLARQTIEDVWMSPFYQPASSESGTSAKYKLAMADQVALMVKTVQRGGVTAVLDKVLQTMLSNDSKFNAANFRVCKSLVATMFETIIDNSANEGKDAPSARDALQVLTIFAKSNAKLFTPEQVKLLQPYIANVAEKDDLAVYRSVVVIFRHVLPHLSSVHNPFLEDVRKELLPAVTRMGKVILDDIVACLWTISKSLDNYQHLTKVVMQTLGGIQQLKNVNLNDPSKFDTIRKVNKLLLITGVVGKHCDLNPQIQYFKPKFPNFKYDSVSKLMVDTFAPFASPEQPLEVRKNAFDAIGMVCQSWPKNFNNANIICSVKEVFVEKNDALEVIIMKAFKEYLLLEEKRSEAGSEDGVGVAAEGTATLGVMGGGQGDGIAIGIAQQFLTEFTRIALATQDDQALLATEIIASITRQGLVHPKECGITLIALETSQNAKIVDLAFRGHRILHEKHETMLEREYMRAVHLAYVYQRDVVQDVHGATLDPFVAKLHMMIEVLKISKPKNRKKFFETLCERIDFDPVKMKVQDLPHHLEFSQFIVENMAFFEYGSVDELLAAIAAMEKVVAGTGTSIAHMIETEIFHISLQEPLKIDDNGASQSVVPTVDSQRLLQLTASSMMLASVWEARTYLRRQYGLTTSRREGKGKGVAKDLNKTPVKVAFVNGDKFWDAVSTAMSAFDSEETMMNQCRSFVDLLNVDPEFKLAAENDDPNARISTPSEDEENGTPGPPGTGRGRKRKNSTTPGGRKKRARSSSIPRGRSRTKGFGKKASVDMDVDDDDDF